MRFPRWFRKMFPRFFPVRWEDGVVDRDLKYAIIYANVVERIRAVRPETIQTPTMRVTVRLYDYFPPTFSTGWGKVLSPNVIAGDTGGTLCLQRGALCDALIEHEMAHAITGISDHPAWLFRQTNNSFFLAV